MTQSLDNHKRVAAIEAIQARLGRMVDEHRYSHAEDNPYDQLLEACVIARKMRDAVSSSKPLILVRR